MTNYALLCKEISSLIDGVSNIISNLANLSSLLYHELTDVNWVGFYVVEDGNLILYPFSGKPACVTIPYGKGVCGTCLSTGEVQLVEDVHKFEGHIACDYASKSEIVLPIRNKAGAIVAVLDIDSPSVSRFSEADKEGLLKVVSLIEPLFPDILP